MKLTSNERRRGNGDVIRRLAIVLAVALLLGTPALRAAGRPRTHIVKEILLDGTDVASAKATVTFELGDVEQTIRRGESIPDGTRVDVPGHVVVVIVGSPIKDMREPSTITLEPGASVSFVSTGPGELLRSNRGKSLFNVVHGALEFFRVQQASQIVAGWRVRNFRWMSRPGRSP